MKATRKLAAVAGATLLATSVFAAPSVEITNVQQQYPWTNTVDITYTVQGVKDFPAQTGTGTYASNETYFVAFTATEADGTTPIPDVDGNTVLTNGLVGGVGTFTAQWHPALNIQKTGCKLTPSVFRGEDDAYLVINLVTNATGRFDHWFEPMSAQAASNARYNTTEYKSTKMVLRRVGPGTYRIGHTRYSGTGPSREGGNSPHDVVVPDGTCYYIGIFPVTRAQYGAIMGTGAGAGDYRPYSSASYNTIRGNALPGADLVGDAANESAVLIRLAGLSGLALDLPTDEMWEIAARARHTTDFFWGDAIDGRYCWTTANTSALPAVGGRLPNDWGVYDTSGLVWEYTRDVKNRADLATKTTDVYTPITSGESLSRNLRAGCWDKNYRTESYCWGASFRGTRGANSYYANRDGFRFAVYPARADSGDGQDAQE